MPYLSTLAAVRGYRHEELLREAARERCAVFAMQPPSGKEGVMVGDYNRGSIIQPSIDEALAYQDIVQRVLVKLSLLARVAGQGFGIALPGNRRDYTGNRHEPRTRTARRLQHLDEQQELSQEQ